MLIVVVPPINNPMFNAQVIYFFLLGVSVHSPEADFLAQEISKLKVILLESP
jgi:hypothetical protein